jgi:hypothetical protein
MNLVMAQGIARFEFPAARQHRWANFTHPRPFASQGDCVQFVLNGKARRGAGLSAAKR